MRAREIDIIRTLVIVALVLYHALAPFTGGWTPLYAGEGVCESLYFWLGQLAYAGMLETFVAISGYVFKLAESRRAEPQPALGLVKSKISRLIIPAILWGVAYRLLFIGGPVLPGLWRIANGIGHLWFLPMLFWCFMLERFVVSRFKAPLWALAIIAVLPYPALPFSFNSSMYYLFFFHLGSLLYQRREKLIRQAGFSRVLYLLAFALPLMVINIELQQSIDLASVPFWPKRALIALFTSMRLLYSFAIVAVYFIVGIKLRHTRNYVAFRFIAECSFGIYLLQEFVIRFFYYHTDFFHGYGRLLPMVGFILGFMVSLIAVAALRKTALGRRIF